MQYNIKEDNEDVGKAVLAAKDGKWDTVFKILKEKPFLINCIPEGRTWGMLHQAVYWKNLTVVSKLLDEPNCDVFIETLQSRNSDARPSSTPREVAVQMGGRKVIEKKLHSKEVKVWKTRFGGKITYQVPKKEGEKIVGQLPLFMMAVINNRKTLLSPGTCPKTHLVDLLKQIFKEEVHNWEKVKHRLYLTVYGICKSAAEKFENSKSERKFFENIVHFYTRPQYHNRINNAISRSFDGNDHPVRAEDLSVALYDLMLDCVLMCWDGLKAVSKTTYRGVRMKVNFKKGSKIMFTHFLSSSLDETIAKDEFCGNNGTLMIIDNSAHSKDRPKDIRDFSQFKREKECLYGIGAEFEVKDIDDSNSYRMVKLKLI